MRPCSLVLMLLLCMRGTDTLAADAARLTLNKHGGAEAKHWPTGITKLNVVARYGKPGGIRINSGGYDVCSLAYTHQVLRKSEFHAMLRPKFQSLNDQAGWPEIFVEPGWLALDPESKRIKFSKGTDTDSFRWVTRIDLGGFASVGTIIDGDIAYMCSTEDGSGVLFLDISDPKSMKVAGNCPIPGFPGTVIKNGHLLYIYGSFQLTVVDVSNPAHPRVVNGIHDRWHVGNRKKLLTILAGEYLAVAHQSFITIFRTYPDGNLDPVVVWDVPGGYNSCVQLGDRLILGGNRGVHVVEVADPLNPVYVQTKHQQPINGIRALGDRLVGYDKEGIISFTVSTAGQVETDPLVPCLHINDLDVVGGFVTVLTGKRNVHDSVSLRLYRVTAAGVEPEPVFNWREEGFINSVYNNHGHSSICVSGNRVLVSDFNFGPRLFLLEGEKLVQSSRMLMAGESRGLRIHDDYLHMAKNGFILIDIFQDPTAPRRVGDVFTRSGCFGLASWADTKRKLAYHAASLRQTPRLIDYTVPARPRIINEEPPNLKGGIWKDGVMIGFSGQRGQLVTYEVSGKGEFHEKAALDVPGWKIGGRRECWMRQIGNLIYVSIGRAPAGQPFTILDISDPCACRILGQVTIEVAANAGIGTPGMYVDSGIAYMGGAAMNGIIVIDCRDPSNPKRAGFIDHIDPAFYSKSINCPDEIVVVGDNLILGDYITGLRMYRFTNKKHTKARYIANYLSPPDYPYASYMNCSGMDYHGRYLYKSNMHDLQVYEIPAPSDVPHGRVEFELVKQEVAEP